MKPGFFRGVYAGFLLAQCRGDQDASWSCNVADEGRLSTWQIMKKGMWDRVRDAKIVSMHPNLLMQSAMALESPSTAHQCPLGVLACRLFLLDIIPDFFSRHDDEDVVAIWMKVLLHEILDTPWQRIVQSGWPIFGLLARLAKQQFSNFTKTAAENIWQQMPLEPVLAGSDVEKAQTILKSAGNLMETFLQDGSSAFWFRLSSYTEEYIFRTALQLGPVNAEAETVILYFLRNLQDEFGGFSGSMDSFFQRILVWFPGHTLFNMRCWDVGAAPWPDESNRRDRDVWEICRSSGLQTEAFEPSQIGFDRLQAAAYQLNPPVRLHQLAVSNTTGQSGFNRGGQVTGSLGRRGCNLASYRLVSASSAHPAVGIEFFCDLGVQGGASRVTHRLTVHGCNKWLKARSHPREPVFPPTEARLDGKQDVPAEHGGSHCCWRCAGPCKERSTLEAQRCSECIDSIRVLVMRGCNGC